MDKSDNAQTGAVDITQKVADYISRTPSKLGQAFAGLNKGKVEADALLVEFYNAAQAKIGELQNQYDTTKSDLDDNVIMLGATEGTLGEANLNIETLEQKIKDRDITILARDATIGTLEGDIKTKQGLYALKETVYQGQITTLENQLSTANGNYAELKKRVDEGVLLEGDQAAAYLAMKGTVEQITDGAGKVVGKVTDRISKFLADFKKDGSSKPEDHTD